MDALCKKAHQIVSTGRIVRGDDCFHVPSQQPGIGRYRVVPDGLFPCCTCPDFDLTGLPCKHLIAVREWLASGAGAREREDAAPAPPPVPPKSYPPDWPDYDKAQTPRKEQLQEVPAGPCAPV